MILISEQYTPNERIMYCTKNVQLIVIVMPDNRGTTSAVCVYRSPTIESLEHIGLFEKLEEIAERKGELLLISDFNT